MGFQKIGQPAVDHILSGPFLQDDQVHRHVVGFQKAEDGIQCHLLRFLHGIAVNAGGNQGESDGCKVHFFRQQETVSITGCQKLPFLLFSVINGACRVNDIPGRQGKSRRCHRIAGVDGSQALKGLLHLLSAGRFENGAAHPAAPSKLPISCIHDGIGFHGGNIIP